MRRINQLPILIILASLFLIAVFWIGCGSPNRETKEVSRVEEKPMAAAPPSPPAVNESTAERDISVQDSVKKMEAPTTSEGYRAAGATGGTPTTASKGRVAPKDLSADVPPPENINMELAKPGDLTQPKIIYNAFVRVRVPNLEKGVDELRDMAGQYGGRVVDARSQHKDGDEYGDAYIKLKIPYDKVQEFVSNLKSLGSVEDSQITSEDVTLKWFDIQKDIEKRKIEMEAKYLDFKANPNDYYKKNEYLRVYNEYLAQSKRAAQLSYDAEMSTVDINLVCYADLWMKALKIGLNILYYILIAVLVLLPCAGLTLLIIWVIRLLTRSRKPKQT